MPNSVNAMEVQKIASRLDDHQKETGVGGPFVGIVHDKLVIAGGTNFPDEPPWRDGKKKYHDSVHVLTHEKNGEYRWTTTSAKLPELRANGASVTVSDGLCIIGGASAEKPTDECWKIVWDNDIQDMKLVPMPKLPMPLTFPAVAVDNQVLYLAGGFLDESTGATSGAFLSLDLKKSGTGDFKWETLPGWNGPSRALSVCAVQNDGEGKAFYLFGGRHYTETGEMIELGDAWRYRFDSKIWEPVENVDGLPFTFSAATAIASGTSHILFLGNCDNEATRERNRLGDAAAEAEKSNAPDAAEIKRRFMDYSDHFPGFSDEIYAYNTITKKLFLLGKSSQPLPLVTSAVSWQGKIVLACGESGPGRRAPDILQITIAQNRSRLGTLNIGIMVLYFGLLIGMGAYFSKRQKGTEDYFRGGHRVSWWIIGISIYGTAMSSISYMAVPVKSYMTNWNFLILSMAPLWASPFIIYFLIPKLRKYNLTSAYEYLERRFNLAIRLFGSFVFIAFQIVRMAVMLFLPAIALNIVTNFDIYTCIIVVGVVSLVYTMFGGIEAVIWTDVLQVVILIGGLIIAFYIAMLRLDVGLVEAARLAAADHKLSLGSAAVNFKEPTIWTVLIASFFLMVIPFSSDQSLVQRYFVSKTDKEAAGGLWINAWMTFPCGILLFAIGTAFYLFYKQHPTELSVVMNSNDSLFPWFIITQMPPGISGLVIVAIFAASMSSVSASVNAISAAYTIDFHRRLWARNEANSLACAKISSLVGGILGILLALVMTTWSISSFWEEYNRLMGLMTSVLAGLFFLGAMSKRANAKGALVGILVGVLVQIYVSHNKSVHILLYSGTGFLSCIFAGYLASWFFPSRKVFIPVKAE